eukprot:1009935-Rhodomonas_salina.1
MCLAGSRVAAGQANGPTLGGKLFAWLTCTCVGSYERTQPLAVQAAGLGSALWGCQRCNPPGHGVTTGKVCDPYSNACGALSNVYSSAGRAPSVVCWNAGWAPKVVHSGTCRVPKCCVLRMPAGH